VAAMPRANAVATLHGQTTSGFPRRNHSEHHDDRQGDHRGGLARCGEPRGHNVIFLATTAGRRPARTPFSSRVPVARSRMRPTADESRRQDRNRRRPTHSPGANDQYESLAHESRHTPKALAKPSMRSRVPSIDRGQRVRRLPVMRLTTRRASVTQQLIRDAATSPKHRWAGRTRGARGLRSRRF